MSGAGKIFWGVGVLVLLVGLVYAAFIYLELSREADALAGELEVLGTENAWMADEIMQQEEWASYQFTQVMKHEQWNSYQSTQIGEQQEALNTLMPGGTLAPTSLPRVYRPPGAVTIAGGSCCVGGTAGETIDVNVQFLPDQTELAEPAVEMRVITGVANVTLADMATQPWEPVAEEINYQVYVATNWTTFWVHVQYRTASGVVSAIYSDEIAVEGMPGVTATP